MEEFENWLRMVCFQKPTPEAYDLAKDAWKEALTTRATPDSIKDIEHVGECPSDRCDGGVVSFHQEGNLPTRTEACPQCNGTGEIRRAATIEEVLEGMNVAMRHFKKTGLDHYMHINNGRLWIKEK